jgi:hypothetical protein
MDRRPPPQTQTREKKLSKGQTLDRPNWNRIDGQITSPQIQNLEARSSMDSEYHIDTNELLHAADTTDVAGILTEDHSTIDDKDRKNEERRKRYKEKKELEQQEQEQEQQHQEGQVEHFEHEHEHDTAVAMADVVKTQDDIDPSSILTSNISAEVVSAAAAAAAAYGGLLPDADDIVQSQEIAQLTQTTMGHGDHSDMDMHGDHGDLQVSHEEHLASRRQKDRERYASMSHEQRDVYNCKRREQYHRQSNTSRKKRRERERIRYHSLTMDRAKERNVRRASLERDRYKRLTADELSARNAKRRGRAASLRHQKKAVAAVVNVGVSLPMEAPPAAVNMEVPGGVAALPHMDPHVHPAMPAFMPPVMATVSVPEVNSVDLSSLPTVLHGEVKEQTEPSVSV